MINPYLRTMLRKDLLPVLQIEQSNSLDPWEEKEFIRFFKNGEAHGKYGLVAEYREQVLGYMLYQVCPNETILVELSIHPDYKRRGVATALLESLVEEAVVNSHNRIVFYSLESNLSSQLFLRSQEFTCVKILRDFYEGVDDDVYEMELKTAISLHDRMAISENLIPKHS